MQLCAFVLKSYLYQKLLRKTFGGQLDPLPHPLDQEELTLFTEIMDKEVLKYKVKNIGWGT